MSLQEWERDVLNRQRNIVFPDTNLNEGRFYRNIASGKAVFSWGLRISLLVIVGYVMTVTCAGMAQVIAAILAQREFGLPFFELWSGIYLLGILLFWIFLAVKGLLPTPRARKRRRGYRQSTRT
jgi:hypothetical protein